MSCMQKLYKSPHTGAFVSMVFGRRLKMPSVQDVTELRIKREVVNCSHRGGDTSREALRALKALQEWRTAFAVSEDKTAEIMGFAT